MADEIRKVFDDREKAALLQRWTAEDAAPAPAAGASRPVPAAPAATEPAAPDESAPAGGGAMKNVKAGAAKGVAAVKAGGSAFKQAMDEPWTKIIEGLRGITQARSTDEAVQRIRDTVLGAFGVPMSVVTAPAAAVGAYLEKVFPQLSGDVFPDGSFLRDVMGQRPADPLDRKAMEAFRAPITGREAVENALMLANGYALHRAGEVRGKAAEAPKAAPAGEPVAAAGEAAPRAAGEPTAAPGEAPAAGGAAPEGAAQPIGGGAAVPTSGGDFTGGKEYGVGGRAFTAREVPPVKPEEMAGLETAATTEGPIPSDTPSPRAFGVNWQRLGSEDQIQRITLEVNKQLTEATAARLAEKGEEVTSEGYGGVRQTHEMTRAEAAKNPFSLTDVVEGRFLRPGDTIDKLPARLTALKSVRDQMDKYLWDHVNLANGGDELAKQDLPAVAAMQRLVADRTKEFTSAVARAQEAGKIDSDSMLASIPQDRLDATIRNLTADMSGETIADVLNRLKDEQGVGMAKGWLHNVTGAAQRGASMAWEYFVTAKLSSPTTWAKKALSDMGTMAYAIPQRALMRMNHVLFFQDDPLGTQAGEVQALARGYERATLDTIRSVWRGQDLNTMPGVQHWNRDPAITAENVGVRGWAEARASMAEGDAMGAITAAPGAAIDGVGAALRFGPRVLEATTKLAQGINFKAEAEAQAVRLARVELQRFEGKTGYEDRFTDRVAEILDKISDFPAVQDAATEAAKRNTYTQDLGPAATAFKDWVTKVPGLKVNQPFYNIPVNLFKRATHFLPPTWVVSRIYGEMGDQWAKGGAAREAALADLETGIAAAAAIGYLVAQSKITGPGPSDPGLRATWLATGRRPYSFYPEGQGEGKPVYEGYHLIAPIGITIGAIATFGEIWGQVPEESEWYDKGLQIGAAFPLALAKTIKDEPFFQSWAQTVDSISQPDKSSGQWLQGFMRGLVPTVWQRAQHAYLDQAMKEVRGPLEAMRAAVWSPGLVDRKDAITGEPHLYPPGLGPTMVSPFTTSTVKPDIVSEEMWAQQMKLARFPWVVVGSKAPAQYVQMTPPSASEGIMLTPAQRDRWIDLTTQEVVVPGAGGNLHDALEKLIMSPKYQTLPVAPDSQERITEMQRIVNDYRKQGLAMLRKEDPELNAEMRVHEETRLRNRLPVTNPKSTGRSPLTPLVESLGR